MSKIKLIWDFRGEGALQTAKHHAVHLNEFLEREKVLDSSGDYAQISQMHSIAFVISDKSNMIVLRDALKPNRGEVYQEE